MMRSSKIFRRGKVNVINRNYKILPTFQANLFYVLFCISITEDDPPAMKHGCLVWWTLHTNQPLDISPV